MLNELFSSQARVSILELFLLNPANNFYQREIAAICNLHIRAVQREVERLEKIGLINRSRRGNRNYYQIDKSSSIFEELKSIFLKTVGLGDILKNSLGEQQEEIAIAFIYGSYAQHVETAVSDLDLFIIGTIDPKKLSSILAKAKSFLKREINYSVYSEEEYRQKIQRGDHFVTALAKEPKIFLVGNDNELRRLVQPR
jgi:DNA-binding MarR family transcriptional regulator